MSTATIPHQFVKLGFAGARLPISVAELLAERTGVAERTGLDVSSLRPVAIYDAVEAQAKVLLGRLIRDDELVGEGVRQEQALRYRAGAEWLSEEAGELRRAADQAFGEQVDRAEDTRARLRRQADEQKAEVRRREAEAKREVEEKTHKREQAVRQAARSRKKAVEAKEREAELARTQAEAEALEKESEAVQAEQVVTAIDEHLDAKKDKRGGRP